MNIAILDYSVGDVDIINAPEMDTDEEIESWLEEVGGYKLSNISWMAGVTRINDMTL